MEANKVNDRFLILASTREIVLSIFFAAVGGGLVLSIASGLLAFQFVGRTAYATMENKAALAKANVELKNLALEVTSCERRIESCINGGKKK